MSIAGSCERGFTLIELVVVMVLISLTAAFAVPQISSALLGDELNAAARRFAGLATEIGQEARLRRTVMTLRFDRSLGLFSAAPVQSGEEGEAAEGGKKSFQLRLDESVQVTEIAAAHGGPAKDMAILFDARGYADKTAVHFRHEDGGERTVLLSPFLGVSKILDGHVSLDADRIVLNNK